MCHRDKLLCVLVVTLFCSAFGEYCFRNRKPSGLFGKCSNRVGDVTTKEDCCAAGGVGWTTKSNGKRCEDACAGQPQPQPQPQPDLSAEGGEGGWSGWGFWTLCSKTCGDGVSRRYRTCRGGAPCAGEDFEESVCFDGHCPIDGAWSDWSDWTECPVTCGGGKLERERECNNPPPQHGGKNCTGQSQLRRSCGTDPCPVNGGWSLWTLWARCPVTCGEGIVTRRRTCTNPKPRHGGAPCENEARESAACNEGPCPIDGGWSSWSDWTECPVTCGGGQIVRERECNNPLPQHGGQDCARNAQRTRKCATDPCPVNGSWSEWSRWSKCSKSCEDGVLTRRRTCTNPAPAHGGAQCEGDRNESAACYEGECPIHGGWGEYGPPSECSGTCDSDTNPVYKEQRRPCNNPPPQFGGNYCIGTALLRIRCREFPKCPIDGGWTEFSEWSACSKTCDDGVRTRSRTCTNPVPRYGGEDCKGNAAETKVCSNPRRCPLDGGWTEWDPWTPCNAPRCGLSGRQMRSRRCTNPSPKRGGAYCAGNIIERRDCKRLCAHWSDWSEWSPCRGGCEFGFQKRYRKCLGDGACPSSDHYQERRNCVCPPVDIEDDHRGSGSGDGSGEGSGVADVDVAVDDEEWDPICDSERSCRGDQVGPEADPDAPSYSSLSIVVVDELSVLKDYGYSIDYDDVPGGEPGDSEGGNNSSEEPVDPVDDSYSSADKPVAVTGAAPVVDLVVPNDASSDSYSFDEEPLAVPANHGVPAVDDNPADSSSDYADDPGVVGVGQVNPVIVEGDDSYSYS